MNKGKVLQLYVTMPDMMRSGHRMTCESFECDANGIIGSRDYNNGNENYLLLLSKKSYDIIEEAGLVLDQGVLMENIYVDIDLYDLKEGDIIEIGEGLFEVVQYCEDYRYLYAFAPELPELLERKRGLFVKPMGNACISVGDEVEVLREADEQ